MMRFSTALLLSFIVLFQSSPAQTQAEYVDTAAISKIKVEGMQHSQAMGLMEYLTSVYGGRLTGSPQFAEAASWAKNKFVEWNLEKPHIETWGPFGKGWTLKRFHMHMIAPNISPLIGYPKAWSPGTRGTVHGKAVRLKVQSDADFEQYRGTLKGAFVLISDTKEIKPNFKPLAERHSDEYMLKLANADVPGPRRRNGAPRDTASARKYREEARLASKILEFCRQEKALVILDDTRGDGGTVMTGAAAVPQPDSSRWDRRVNSFDPGAPPILPQVSLTAEHYNRLVRILEKGIPVELEMNLEVEFSDPVDGMNVLAEIPGTDLKDEVVMIGAHLDSWHAGQGAADNGTGVITCMEAMRILKALDLKPRRTIRIGLWGGEEQGLLGSRAYVGKYLAERDSVVKKKIGYENFCAYFNDDYGNGKARGIYMQGNEALRPIFRAWLAPLQDIGATTVTPANAGGTDHLTFDAVGLPGFQFIQDPVEYGRTYHTNMDTFERVLEDDLKQTSVVMAAFAYDAAMRPEKLPRKTLP